jgi:hypothetical protein
VPQFGLIAGEKIFDGAKFLPHVLKVGTRVSISDAEFLTASTSHPRLIRLPRSERRSVRGFFRRGLKSCAHWAVGRRCFRANDPLAVLAAFHI